MIPMYTYISALNGWLISMPEKIFQATQVSADRLCAVVPRVVGGRAGMTALWTLLFIDWCIACSVHEWTSWALFCFRKTKTQNYRTQKWTC